ncbi:MAG: hypothetical protein E7Z89_06160 [Cyanobacteria bacterium SIG28]|nr:hypothetical protein [Cyanobacteria bacterium SIG28]
MKRILITLIILSMTLPAHAFFWNKKDKALEAELEGKGYAGTLPDLNKNKQVKEHKTSTPVFESHTDFNEPKELKPIPRNNPAFIDIIEKKDVTSEYVIDANELIPIIEKLVDCIESNGNVQLFVTRANVLAMNIDFLINKYEGLPESHYESFKKLLEINRSAKTLVQLRQEAVTYQRYLAYQASGSIYNPENINQQLQYFLEELNTAIIMLRDEE